MRFVAVWAVLGAVGTAGCASGGHTSARRTPNGEAAEAPAQIIRDAAAALGQVRSFHLAGTGRDLQGARISTTADFGIPGRLHLVLVQGGSNVEVILVGGYGYLKADRAYWAAHSSRAAVISLFADHWLKVPAASTPGIAEFAAWTQPATIGQCLVEKDLGTISLVGHGTVADHPAVILADHGDLPGSTPGHLYVSSTGPPLPLRIVQTGTQRPGGLPDRICNETRTSPSTVTAGDLRLTRYNEPVNISAPAGAIDLSALKQK